MFVIASLFPRLPQLEHMRYSKLCLISELRMQPQKKAMLSDAESNVPVEIKLVSTWDFIFVMKCEKFQSV